MKSSLVGKYLRNQSPLCAIYGENEVFLSLAQVRELLPDVFARFIICLFRTCNLGRVNI